MTDPEAAVAEEAAEEVASNAGEESMGRVVELVEYIAKSLAGNPDAVKAEAKEQDDLTVITLTVDERDKGRVIGRQGRVAQAMRSILRVAAVKQDTRINLEIE